MELVPMICVLVTGHLADKPTHGERRRSKYILGDERGAEGVGSLLILDLKMAICGAFLVQFFAVQLKL